MLSSEALRLRAFLAQHAPAVKLTGLPDPDPERRILDRDVFALWASAARQLRDPALPLRFASSTRPEDFGVLGFAAMTAPNVREALARAFRFQRLVSDSGRWTLDDDGDLATIRWDRTGPRDLGHRLANETVIAELVSATRALVGELRPRAIWFRHPAPPGAGDAHQRFFGCRVQWEAEQDAWAIATTDLARVPGSSNPALAQYFERELERRAAAFPADTLVDRTRREITADLLSGSPDAASIAHRLDKNERTLRRELAREGTSFRELLDEVRRARALEILASPQSRITEVAFSLGFSETSAFSRAFRRWFGCAPSDRAGVNALRSGLCPPGSTT